MKADFELVTDRLILRPYKNVDLLDLVEAIQQSDDTLSRWLPWCSAHYNQHDAHEWIHASQQNWLYDICYEFAIFHRDDDEFLGSISISNLSEITNSGELGYWIKSSAQQQGFATEACREAARFAFSKVKLTRIEIVTHLGNLASQRTALACNAKFECTARNRVIEDGHPINGLLFSLIPTDIPQNPAPRGNES
ncbi:N-acetyltransferase [Photobacterium sanctipauli]|uniref:N-acetyltransferase n=1 Tax=Photobacterium sanctipauli TaxID=1342794 RepID=A0A2T3NY60_9GAMM|nr:GNAT family N-acetyltransferase [Photobacterium sanctipauli]PSW21138.1 N-acetyltransferase [Photobacterium sanctipauli]